MFIVTYLNGDDIEIEDCATVNDIKVKVASKHERFEPEVRLFTRGDTVNEIKSKDELPMFRHMIGIFEDVIYTDEMWAKAMVSHAIAMDSYGINRALRRIRETSNVKENNNQLRLSGPQILSLAITLFLSDVMERQKRAPWNVVVKGAADDGLNVVKLLLSHNALADFENTRTGGTPLRLSCSIGNMDMCQILIDAGADVNHVGRYGRTPLIIACAEGKLDVVKLLINTCADVDSTNDDASIGTNIGCLKLASMQGRIDIYNTLCKKLYHGRNYDEDTTVGSTGSTIFDEYEDNLNSTLQRSRSGQQHSEYANMVIPTHGPMLPTSLSV